MKALAGFALLAALIYAYPWVGGSLLAAMVVLAMWSTRRPRPRRVPPAARAHRPGLSPAQLEAWREVHAIEADHGLPPTRPPTGW